MLRFLKFVFIFVALLMTLSIVAVIVILNIDPNNHKDWISERFEEETGRELTLDGDIGLTFYPWLGIRLEQVSVADDPAFSNDDFFSTGQARMRIRLLPLLRGEIEIDTVVLHDTHLRLIVNDIGRGNWESLAGEEITREPVPETEADAGSGEIPRIVIGGVDIRNLNVTYEDRQTPNRYTLEGLDFSIPALTLGEPIPMDMQARILIAEPELEMALQMDALLDYASDGMAWTLGPLNLQADLSGPTVPGGSATATLGTRASVDLNEQSLSIPELNLDALGFNLQAEASGEQIDTEAARFNAQLTANSDDLSSLVGVFDPDMAERIAAMDARGINIQARTSVDLGEQRLDVPALLVDAFGFNLQAQASGEQIDSEDARFNAQLTADSDDLSTLVRVVDPDMANRIATMDSRSINLQARTSVDLGEQQLEVPELIVDAFGFNLQAEASGEQIDTEEARFQGRLNADSNDLSTLVTLFDPDMASRIAAMETRDAHIEARFDATPGMGRVDVPVLDAEVLGLTFSAEAASTGDADTAGFEGSMQLEPFSPRQLLDQLGIPLPTGADPTVLDHLALEGRFSGDQQQVTVENLTIALDDTSIESRLDYVIDSSAIDFAVNVDSIDLDRYLPAGEEETPAAADTEGPAELPLETLRELQVDGVVNIGHLVASGLTLEETRVDISARDGQITVTPTTTLYSGSYSGELALDVREDTPVVRIDADMTGVNLGNLTRDALAVNYLRGNGNVSFSLQGRGIDPAALRESLQGSGRMALTEGRLYGIDIASLLEQVEAMIEEGRQIEITRGEYTAFDDFSGSFMVDSGVITTNDLLLAAPGYRVQGAGTLLNLRDETFDFRLTASEDPATAESEEQRFDLDGYSIPITCRGSVSSPACVPNLEIIIQEALSREVQRRFGELLQRAFESDDDEPQQE